MLKIYWLLLIIVSSILPVVSTAQGHSHASNTQTDYASKFKFIKNKGQFNAHILYKTEIPSGNLFIENNRLVYDFKDLSSVNQNHGHSAPVDPNWRNNPIKAHCFYVNFINSNKNCQIIESKKSDGFHNYYLGNDPSKWASDVPLFESLSHNNLYPNIDMHTGSSDGKLKFEFVVKEGGDLNDIELEYDGLTKMQIKKGELYLYTSLGEIVEEQPYAYQIIDGEEVEVKCHYSMVFNKIKFDLPNGYNSKYELVIDPTLIFSTYSGSFSDNFGVTATYDSQGFLYSGSIVFGAIGRGYPTTPGAYQTAFAGGSGTGGVDINISKYDTTGTKFIYSTYLGGNEDEMPHSLVVNSRDELYIFGTTSSKNFPTDSLSYQRNMNNPTSNNQIRFIGLGITYTLGTDLFVFKFSADGKKRIASTYIGGSNNDGVNDTTVVLSHTLRYNYADEIRGEIDIDKNDNIYLATCTNSPDFPMIGNSFDTTFNGGGQDGIIIKMTNDLDSVFWSSFLGGSGRDAIYSLAIDKGDNIYVAGGTTSKDTIQFKTGANKNHLVYGGGRSDGFLTHVKNDGSSILNSTYFGTKQYDQIYFVELDRKGFVYVYGQTEDTTNFYLKNALYGKSKEGVFISKLSAKLDTTLWSTLIGSGGNTSTLARPQLAPSAFLVDVCNSIYYSGWGGATNNSSLGGSNSINNNLSRSVTGMDTTSDAFKKTTNGNDFYLGAISSDASQLLYGSFYGGNLSNEHVDGGTSRFDKKGIIYQSVCAGCGGNSDFPIKPAIGAVSSRNNSTNCNNGVFKMDFKPPSIISNFQIQRKICLRDSILLKNLSKVMKTPKFFWNFGNGDSSTKRSPKVFYDSVGTYTIRLILTDTSSCNGIDTVYKKVTVEAPNAPITLPSDTICMGKSIVLGQKLNPLHDFTWMPGNSLDDSTKMNPKANPTASTNYKLEVKTESCIDTVYQFIKVDSFIVSSVVFPDSVCIPDSVELFNSGLTTNKTSYQWYFSGIPFSRKSKIKLGINTKGNYSLKLVISDSISCNLTDSSAINIQALSDTSYQLPDVLACQFTNTLIGPLPVSGYQYLWQPSFGLNDSTLSNPTTNLPDDTNYVILVDRGVCTDTLFQFVKVDSLIQASLVLPDSVCKPDSVTLSNFGKITSTANYQWYFSGLPITNNRNFKLGLTKKGLYSIKLVVNDSLSCNLSDSSSISILALSDSSYALPDVVSCNYEMKNIGLDSVTGYSYKWIPGKGLSDSTISKPSVTPSKDIKYTLLVDRGVCTDTVSQNLLFDTIAVRTSNDTSICFKVGNIKLINFSRGVGVNFIWSSNKLFSDTLLFSKNDSNFSVSPLQFRNLYYSKAISNRGCEAFDSSVIIINSLGIKADDNKNICLGDTIQISIKSGIPNDTLDALWSPYEFIIGRNDTTHILVNPPKDKLYRVVVENSIKCLINDSVFVKVSTLNPRLGGILASRDTILKNQSSQLKVTPEGFNYNWNPSHSLSNSTSSNPIASPDTTTTYEVNVFDKDNPNCKIKKSITVVVEELYCEEPWLFIPNSFSPNNDGNNDVFYFRGRHILDFSMKIYNRWGELLFETTNPNTGWDGMYKGNMSQADVYVYLVKATCLDGQLFDKKGDVTLIH